MSRSTNAAVHCRAVLLYGSSVAQAIILSIIDNHVDRVSGLSYYGYTLQLIALPSSRITVPKSPTKPTRSRYVAASDYLLIGKDDRETLELRCSV